MSIISVLEVVRAWENMRVFVIVFTGPVWSCRHGFVFAVWMASTQNRGRWELLSWEIIQPERYLSCEGYVKLVSIKNKQTPGDVKRKSPSLYIQCLDWNGCWYSFWVLFLFRCWSSAMFLKWIFCKRCRNSSSRIFEVLVSSAPSHALFIFNHMIFQLS